MPATSTATELSHSDENTGQRGGGGGVQSIERAFAILNHIAQNEDGISLAELSKAVGLHTSTTFHLVRTMVELGAVRQVKSSKRYHLGRLIFTLAASSSRERDLVDVATPYLEALANETGEGSHLALLSGADVLIAARVAGTGAFQMVERAGGIRPAHCTGLGKVLLASMTDSQFASYLTGTTLEPWTMKSITDPELLRQEVDEVRRTGVGFDDAEFNDEVRCIAAPILDFSGQTVAAIGISGPIWRMNLQRMEQHTQHVRQVAAEISEELGYTAG